MFNLPFFNASKDKQDTATMSIMDKDVRLVVGLGNPGDKYKNTFHNVGFMLLDSLAQSMSENNSGEPSEWKSENLFSYIKTQNVILAKPNTFMNESGRAVKEMVKKFNVSPDEILIVHDDSDIALGSYKLAFDRGAAGHNGVTSITQILKTRSFMRLRIGVRTGSEKAGSFVLKPIGKSVKEIINNLLLEIQTSYFKV